MAIPFSRSIRSLSAERTHVRASAIKALAVVVMLGLWGAWAMWAEVALRETGILGRLESVHAAHVVGAPLNGKVTRMATELGREVLAGDVLVELDGREAEAWQRQAMVRRDALVAQLDAIAIELEAAQAVVDAIARGSSYAVAEAHAERHRAAEEARWAREQAARAERLAAAGVSSEEDKQRASVEAASSGSEARAAALATRRVAGEARTREADALVQIESLRREQTRLVGERDAAETEIERLATERSRRRITAPIDGVVGELADLRPGSVVLEGQPMVVIVPHGPLHAVAQFPSSRALGRLHAGQPAQMRLAGFPWTRFGMIELRVATVATEPRGGRLRVELSIEQVPSGVPLAHGLEGSVEVEVERVSPFELGLRSVGHAVAGQPPADDTSELDPRTSPMAWAEGAP